MKLSGTMLTPGVSRNGRLYTPEVIEKAYARLVERLADGSQPVDMLTHHAAGDDSTRIVGKVTGVSLNGGNLDYTAELASTHHAKTIEGLVGGDDPFLKNVSIRGYWLGPLVTKNVDGQMVETADDLEIDGLDFTKSPGVIGATVKAASETTSEAAAGRVAITETVTARVAFTETVSRRPSFADNGYRADKIKRFPIGDRAAAETSWARINIAENTADYTAPQLKRIRGRIKESLKKFGADMTETATAPADAPIVEGVVKLSDVTECYDCWGDPVGTAGFSISAYNGPLTVTVSAYSGIEPADLAGVATAAMAAAVAAVHALDPDDDGDLDAGTADEGAEETTATSPAGGDPVTETVTPTAEEAVVAEERAPEAAPTEETADQPAEQTEATETAETVADDAPITRAELGEAITAAVAAALAAQQSPATETAPAETETTETSEPGERQETIEERDQRIRLETISAMRESGLLTRKGFNAVGTEESEQGKPLHEMSSDELRAYAQEKLVPHFIPVER